jgi:trehalose/maltose hydrolase-like predicted phosphorylase
VTDSPWAVEFEGFSPAEEGRREALCTLGNGVFATRGAAPESRADGVHYPGTYAAGLFNRLESEVEGRRLEHESMVNLPNWLPLTFRAGEGPWFGEPGWEVVRQRQVLDLRRAMLSRSLVVRDPDGRETAVEERRIISMDQSSVAGVEWVVTPAWEGRITVRSFIDAGVENRNVADERHLAGHHLRVVDAGVDGEEVCWLDAETTQSRIRIVEAARTHIVADGPVERSSYHEGDRIGCELVTEAVPGMTVRIEKVVAVHTAHDRAISEPRVAALETLREAGGFEAIVVAHEDAWERLWRQAELRMGNGRGVEAARILNLHILHVLQTLSPHVADRDVGVPARGLHGEGYRGHIFWDELFIFPFLNLRLPDLTRALLLYRYRRLPAARRAARAAGHRGAMYPWQSGSDGREETPTQFWNPRSHRWIADNSRRQRHVGLAVAYNVWQYFEVTGDMQFLASYGAEMLVEIARFFVDLAEHDPGGDRFHIRGVMGPDEFHDGYPDRPGRGVDDNAYTNVMVSWLLQCAIDAYKMLAHQCRDLWEQLELTGDEVARWDEVSRRLTVPFFEDGMIEQFAGYGDLAELDWEAYRERYPDIGRLDLILESEGDQTNRYQLSKQADVLMLFYLFSAEELHVLLGHMGYDFEPDRIPATVDYYLARTSNGSTLSRVANAWVLSRLDSERSWGSFREALVSDFDDIQGGTTPEGIHLGAMAGTIDLVQRCYMGVEPRSDVLWFDPALPADLDRLGLSLRYRGHWLDVEAADGTLTVSLRPSDAAPIRIGLVERVVEVGPGETVSVAIDPNRFRGDNRPVTAGPTADGWGP